MHVLVSLIPVRLSRYPISRGEVKKFRDISMMMMQLLLAQENNEVAFVQFVNPVRHKINKDNSAVWNVMLEDIWEPLHLVQAIVIIVD